MVQCVCLINLVLTLLIYLTQSQDTSTALLKNGTFIMTKFNDKDCETTTDIEGFIPGEKYWKVKAFQSKILMPISFNPNISRLSYKVCTDVKSPKPGDIKTMSCEYEYEYLKDFKTMSCGNECSSINNSTIYYSCNYMPKSNLSLFTFTGFGDSGCNNNNGNTYPLPLTKACWNLEGDGSMSITSFIERRMTVNIYSTNDCKGKILEYNKGFECDESCIDNPINEEAVYYQCKYTSSSFIHLILSLLVLYIILLN